MNHQSIHLCELFIQLSKHKTQTLYLTETGECTNGDVRLIGGDTEYEGTIELCLQGKWGSICHNAWGVNDANVVCKQLGYSAAGNTPYYAAFYGPSSGAVLLNQVQCTGAESTIIECPVDSSPPTTCTHLQDAAVACLPICKCNYNRNIIIIIIIIKIIYRVSIV